MTRNDEIFLYSVYFSVKFASVDIKPSIYIHYNSQLLSLSANGLFDHPIIRNGVLGAIKEEARYD